MTESIIFSKLKGLHRPRVVLFSQGLRYSGIVVALDEDLLELYDDVRKYRKFIRLNLIDDLEVTDEKDRI